MFNGKDDSRLMYKYFKHFATSNLDFFFFIQNVSKVDFETGPIMKVRVIGSSLASGAISLFE